MANSSLDDRAASLAAKSKRTGVRPGNRADRCTLIDLDRVVRAALWAALLLACLAHPVRAAEFPLPMTDTIVGEIRVVTVQSDVTLYDIARYYDLGFEEITNSNPDMNVWVPGRGRRIIVATEFILPPKPWSGIVINLAARRLYYFPKPTHGKPATVVTFPIGIGRLDWPTPLGRSAVIAKVRNPSWVVPKTILAEHQLAGEPLPPVVPPGPNNPMGLLALETGFPGVFIHGTNKPWGVGGLVSHGCIRLYPEDVAAIFDRVAVGTPVRIIDSPDLIGERNGALFQATFNSSSERPDGASSGERAVGSVIAFLGNRLVAIDWGRVRATAELASTVPTPISANTIDFWDLAGDVPAHPYTEPAYGPEANTAIPPGAATR
jgi:L,D-transpeptidase ErfK/SrfK